MRSALSALLELKCLSCPDTPLLSLECLSIRGDLALLATEDQDICGQGRDNLQTTSESEISDPGNSIKPQ